MAKLHVVWDPDSKVIFDTHVADFLKVKSAHLDIRDDLKNADIYNLARKLAEMLLEQL